MDKSEVKAWVDENAERLKLELGLDHWRLVINHDGLPPGEDGAIRAMTVKTKPEYERATIWINFDAIEDTGELEYHFRHELLHLMHAPFDLIYGPMYEMFTEEQIRVVNVMWNRAEELTVRNLERMYISLTGGKDA